MAELGNRSEASLLTERHSCPFPLQGMGAAGHCQFFPGGPPCALYSMGLNCQAVTGNVLVMWYAPLSARTEPLGRPELVQLSKSGPLRSATHGKKIFSSPPGCTVVEATCVPARSTFTSAGCVP